ncbi:MAG: hypothetical protein JWP65_2548 [Ramlibacter sp.]|uniref:CHAT domain-containing protein n=1 Tax=Ramlibacter sp. TaxID=1917967 RepID=UPI002609CC9B|nr:CHAT domain-containing protein [Ramlibacter sp.]MDB5752127.1 hypothetical protein [Ramlibacter sp.]
MSIAFANPTAVALGRVMSRSFVVVNSHWTGAQALSFLRGVRTSHVVILRVEDEGRRYLYLHSRGDLQKMLRARGAHQTVREALDLHEHMAVEQCDTACAADSAPPVAVVTDGAAIVGFVDSRSAPGGGAQVRSFDLGLAGLTGGLPGIIRGLQRLKPFRAYPALTAPEVAVAQVAFDVFVGFRSTPDPVLGDAKQIEVPAPDPDKQCLVLLSGDGVTLDREHDLIALRNDVVVRFTGTLRPGVEVGSVKVHYVYDQQVIGGARREIRSIAAALPVAAQAHPTPCRMSLPEAGAAVDLTVSVTHLNDGTLEWRFIAPACSRHDTTLKLNTRLSGTSEFAAGLMRDLRAVKFRGPFGRNVLENVGRDVAGLIPPLFFEILAAVHAALGRTPTLLWLTDEAYVPWELALLPAPLDPGAPPFLAAQTRMGRWLDDEQVMLPPPRALEVQRVSVVASKYGLAAGQRELTHAIAERTKLCDEWQGQPFEATADDLVTLASGAKLAGHLVHLAVHGFSDPMANAQSLLLADKSELPASALAGGHNCGEPPRFAFVFLNACQVGTPGRSLGQAGGFPGALLRGGANGVIAPLWDVDDSMAFAVAQDFYERVFRDGSSVAAALQARRRCYDGDATTPVAYIYYGHPALALRRAA